MEPILILNNTRASMSLGRYTKTLTDFLKEHARVITLTYSKHFPEREILGERLRGLNTPFMSGWHLNRNFQGLIYRKRVEKIREESQIAHFTSNAIYPFFKDDKAIVTIPDLILLKKQFRDRIPERYMLRQLEGYKEFENVICHTDYVKQDLQENGFQGDISVVPLPHAKWFRPLENKDGLRKELNLPLDKKLILSVSLNIKRKNLGLVEAVDKELGDDYRLVRVGSQLGDSITFNNGITDTLMNKIYNACDILFFPSLEEGYGYPLVEAFATGLPTVALDIPVTREVADGAANLVSNNASDSAAAIKEVLSNREDYIQRGFERSRRFTPEMYEERMRSLYSRVQSH